MDNKKVLFLDIDGTILQPDHTIEQSTKEAIRQVQEQGIEVFLATGRPLHEVYDIAKVLNIHSYIGYNGALAIYNGKEIVNEPMDAAIIDYYLNVAKDHDHEMVLYTSDKNAFSTIDTPVVKHFIDYFDLRENVLFHPSMNQDILGITLINLSENDPSLYQTDASIYFSQVNVEGLQHSYDVIRENVNKGRAIKAVLDLLGMDPANAIAFGDGMNDKEMLQIVGESFAMGNAHPDLFRYAKHKTTTVTNSGIYHGLKSIDLVK